VADISVQVSSAGLTAYGAGTWSSQSFGGDNVTNVSIGSVDAFNSEGWGRLTWGSLVWGEDFAEMQQYLSQHRVLPQLGDNLHTEIILGVKLLVLK
jgi:hypothetical protein